MPLLLHQYYPFRLSILCEGHETIKRGHWPQLVELVFEQVSACLVAVVSGARWAQTLSSANVELRCKPINVTFLVFYSLLMPRTGCGSSVSSTLSQSLCQQPVTARQVCVRLPLPAKLASSVVVFHFAKLEEASSESRHLPGFLANCRPIQAFGSTPVSFV